MHQMKFLRKADQFSAVRHGVQIFPADRTADKDRDQVKNDRDDDRQQQAHGIARVCVQQLIQQLVQQCGFLRLQTDAASDLRRDLHRL